MVDQDQLRYVGFFRPRQCLAQVVHDSRELNAVDVNGELLFHFQGVQRKGVEVPEVVRALVKILLLNPGARAGALHPVAESLQKFREQFVSGELAGVVAGDQLVEEAAVGDVELFFLGFLHEVA